MLNPETAAPFQRQPKIKNPCMIMSKVYFESYTITVPEPASSNTSKFYTTADFLFNVKKTNFRPSEIPYKQPALVLDLDETLISAFLESELNLAVKTEESPEK